MISVQRKKEKVNKYKGLARALKNLKKDFFKLFQKITIAKKININTIIQASFLASNIVLRKKGLSEANSLN